jgi:hypothetical protein
MQSRIKDFVPHVRMEEIVLQAVCGCVFSFALLGVWLFRQKPPATRILDASLEIVPIGTRFL